MSILKTILDKHPDHPAPFKLEVKNVKIHDDISEETVCFSCSVWVDGKRIGTAENCGKGGPNMYHFKNNGRNFEKEIEAFAKTLPPRKTDFGDGKIHEIDYSMDCVVTDLVIMFDERRRMKRYAKKHCIFTVPGEEDTYRQLKAPDSPDARAFVLRKYPGAKFLNDEL
jgi:hypothetical protein